MHDATITGESLMNKFFMRVDLQIEAPSGSKTSLYMAFDESSSTRLYITRLVVIAQVNRGPHPPRT